MSGAPDRWPEPGVQAVMPGDDGTPSGMRGPVGFFAVLLFWLSLVVTLLPAVLYAISLVLDLVGASPSTVSDWAMGAAFALILAMISGPAALVCGIIALATRPAARR